jgi:hypothetical protein
MRAKRKWAGDAREIGAACKYGGADPKKGWSPGAGIAGAPSNLIQHEL